MSYTYNYGTSAANNLFLLLQSQNNSGLTSALLSGAEPENVLISKILTNSFNQDGPGSTPSFTYITLPSQATNPPAAPASSINIFSDSNNKFAWIGASGFVRSFDGTLTASRSYILPDANSSFPVYPFTVTYAGITAARTITYPDASFTAARTDAANSFTGIQTILSTSTLRFGATALATIGVSADTTAGVFTFIAPSTGTFSFNNAFSSIAGVAVTGKAGVPLITSAPAISATKTANFTANTYTPPASAGQYVISGVITTTSATNTGTVQFTVDYVDSQGTVHTADVIPLIDAAGALAATKTGASKEFRMVPQMITINNAATAIVVKVVITGSVSYTVAATIEQMA